MPRAGPFLKTPDGLPLSYATGDPYAFSDYVMGYKPYVLHPELEARAANIYKRSEGMSWDKRQDEAGGLLAKYVYTHPEQQQDDRWRTYGDRVSKIMRNRLESASTPRSVVQVSNSVVNAVIAGSGLDTHRKTLPGRSTKHRQSTKSNREGEFR